jgi:hypothetical protein
MIQDTGYRVKAKINRILGTGYSTQDTGCKFKDTGYKKYEKG